MQPFWKSWVFVVFTTGFILWAGWMIDRRDGLLWAVPLVLGINYFLLIHSHWRIVFDTNAEDRPLEGNDGWSVTKSLQALCAKAQIKPPKVRVIESSTPQAFLIGRTSRFSTLYVTQGFLDRLDASEREAILAMQVATLKMNLQFNFFVLGAFFNIIFWFVSHIDSVMSWIIGAKRRRASSVTLWLMWPFLYIVRRWCLSSEDYYRIDAKAAELCSDKDALCQALWKLESSSLTQPLNISPAWPHAFAVTPLEPRGPLGRLQPQPSAKQRILHLNGGFPV